MFSCFWATGDSKVFKWKTGPAVGGARPSQQVQSVCITHLGKPLEMWKMLNVLGSKHFIAVRHNWSVKTFMNLTTTFNYTLWFCILKSQNVPKSPQITPEVPKIMHLSQFFPMCILLQLSANSLSLLSSTNELIVAFEITLFFNTWSHSTHHPPCRGLGRRLFLCTCTRDLDSWRRFLPIYPLLHIILPITVTCMIMFCMSFLYVVPFCVLIAICAFFVSSYNRTSLSLLNPFFGWHFWPKFGDGGQ